jgi:hypothetical protein
MLNRLIGRSMIGGGVLLSTSTINGEAPLLNLRLEVYLSEKDMVWGEIGRQRFAWDLRSDDVEGKRERFHGGGMWSGGVRTKHIGRPRDGNKIVGRGIETKR